MHGGDGGGGGLWSRREARHKSYRIIDKGTELRLAGDVVKLTIEVLACQSQCLATVSL